MLLSTQSAPNERPPACRRCGGTGFVYLWSIAVDASRTWFCDRSGCKLFWHDTGRRAIAVANDGASALEIQPVVTLAEEPQLQPV